MMLYNTTNNVYIQMAPDCTDVTGLYRWHRIIQMVPSCTDVTGLYRWQRIVQMAPDCTDGTGLYRCHRIVQMSPDCIDGTGLYRWHRIVLCILSCYNMLLIELHVSVSTRRNYVHNYDQHYNDFKFSNHVNR